MAMQREPEQFPGGGAESLGLSITVRIPTPLRKLTGDEAVVAGEGETLIECIDGLETRYPGLKERLCDETGDLRRFVNVYVNGEDVRFLSGLATRIESGAEVSIVPAVAGGAR
jgi:molybdopterin synthase sulfur carrier subunit